MPHGRGGSGSDPYGDLPGLGGPSAGFSHLVQYMEKQNRGGPSERETQYTERDAASAVPYDRHSRETVGREGSSPGSTPHSAAAVRPQSPGTSPSAGGGIVSCGPFSASGRELTPPPPSSSLTPTAAACSSPSSTPLSTSPPVPMGMHRLPATPAGAAAQQQQQQQRGPQYLHQSQPGPQLPSSPVLLQRLQQEVHDLKHKLQRVQAAAADVNASLMTSPGDMKPPVEADAAARSAGFVPVVRPLLFEVTPSGQRPPAEVWQTWQGDLTDRFEDSRGQFEGAASPGGGDGSSWICGGGRRKVSGSAGGGGGRGGGSRSGGGSYGRSTTSHFSPEKIALAAAVAYPAASTVGF